MSLMIKAPVRRNVQPEPVITFYYHGSGSVDVESEPLYRPLANIVLSRCGSARSRDEFASCVRSELPSFKVEVSDDDEVRVYQ
jgi:hypothetical protein